MLTTYVSYYHILYVHINQPVYSAVTTLVGNQQLA